MKTFPFILFVLITIISCGQENNPTEIIEVEEPIIENSEDFLPENNENPDDFLSNEPETLISIEEEQKAEEERIRLMTIEADKAAREEDERIRETQRNEEELEMERKRNETYELPKRPILEEPILEDGSDNSNENNDLLAYTETSETKTFIHGDEKISHFPLDAMLKRYVSSNGSVNYDGFKNDHSRLKAYLSELSHHTISDSWSRNEKLTYWINAYNAFTIDLILQNYPVKSIMDINGGKAWDLKFIKLGDKTYSLNQIENEIIRPTFKEPRIHFAVNCAAQSCPKLMNGAFFADKLDAQLEKQTKAFVNNTTKNSISETSISVSKIFEWYSDDFGNLISFLNKYSDTKIKSNATISYMEYKWNLNK
jgi:hypothetical protein